MHSSCRDAGKRPGCADVTRRIRRGDGAPKSANPCVARVPWQDARRLSARHGGVYAGRRAALSPEIRCFRSSASSWQGLDSGPGRSPGTARVPGLRTRPAGAAPRPASRRLARAPLKRTRWQQDRCGFGGGDYFQLLRPGSNATDPFRTCEALNSYLQFSPSDPFQSPRGHGAMCYVLAAFTRQVTAPLNNNL
jgi:hypothetical protein